MSNEIDWNGIEQQVSGLVDESIRERLAGPNGIHQLHHDLAALDGEATDAEVFEALQQAAQAGAHLSHLAQCALASGGSRVGARLLYVLKFGTHRRGRSGPPPGQPKIDRLGRTSRVASAEVWCAETGLSAEEFERAVAVLRSRNLIEVQQRGPLLSLHTTNAPSTPPLAPKLARGPTAGPEKIDEAQPQVLDALLEEAGPEADRGAIERVVRSAAQLLRDRPAGSLTEPNWRRGAGPGLPALKREWPRLRGLDLKGQLAQLAREVAYWDDFRRWLSDDHGIVAPRTPDMRFLARHAELYSKWKREAKGPAPRALRPAGIAVSADTAADTGQDQHR